MKDNSKRAKNAILLIWIIFCIDLLRLLFDTAATISLSGMPGDMYVDDDFSDVWYLLALFTHVGYIIFYIISGVLFIQWFRRAYFNLHSQIHDLSFSEGWAAGCWFVPILNLFRPHAIMVELYTKTKHLILTKTTQYNIKISLSTVNMWWLLWVIESIYTRITERMARNDINVADNISSFQLDALGTILELPLCILAIKIIKDYSKMEKTLADLTQIERINSDDLNSEITGELETKQQQDESGTG